MRGRAEEGNAIGNALALRQRGQRGFLFAAAGDREAKIGPIQPREGLHQQVEALLADQPPDRDDIRPFRPDLCGQLDRAAYHRAIPRRRGHDPVVEALVPMADRGDEIRFAQLEGERAAIDEQIGGMTGEAEAAAEPARNIEADRRRHIGEMGMHMADPASAQPPRGRKPHPGLDQEFEPRGTAGEIGGQRIAHRAGRLGRLQQQRGRQRQGRRQRIDLHRLRGDPIEFLVAAAGRTDRDRDHPPAAPAQPQHLAIDEGLRPQRQRRADIGDRRPIGARR